MTDFKERARDLAARIRPHHDGTLDTWADPDDLLEMCDVAEKLASALEEAEDRVKWFEEHGPNCECRECRIP
jgi:hypothetical protein